MSLVMVVLSVFKQLVYVFYATVDVLILPPPEVEVRQKVKVLYSFHHFLFWLQIDHGPVAVSYSYLVEFLNML